MARDTHSRKLLRSETLFVQDGLLRFLVEEVQMVCIECDPDLVAGSAGSAGINTGDDVPVLAGGAQVQIGF